MTHLNMIYCLGGCHASGAVPPQGWRVLEGLSEDSPHPLSPVLSSYNFLLPHLAILLLMGIFWKRLDFK